MKKLGWEIEELRNWGLDAWENEMEGAEREMWKGRLDNPQGYLLTVLHLPF